MKHIAGWLQVVPGEPGGIEKALVAMAPAKELTNRIFRNSPNPEFSA